MSKTIWSLVEDDLEFDYIYEEVDTPTATLKREFAFADLDVVNYDDEDYESATEDEANLVISKIEGKPGFHAPVLDIDIPHRLVPSSTEGHSHLYIDISCTWDDYKNFLEAAVKIGLLEEGYVNASLNRGFTAVRKPGITKNISNSEK